MVRLKERKPPERWELSRKTILYFRGAERRLQGRVARSGVSVTGPSRPEGVTGQLAASKGL